MRSKKAAVNTIWSLIQEVVSFVCGFILPRLILTAFGSKYNGLFTSISQFLACAVLLRSGIGGATRAALYKPLAENNQEEINAIVKATDIFMKKIGIILAGLIVVFAALFSFLLQNEFDWLFTFSLFLIIGASKFAESFFGITYLIVLQADQKLWVQSLIYSICLILNTAISAILITLGASIHLVKLGSAIVFVAHPIVMGLYVKHHYKIDMNVEPNNKAISQRWDAFWQQVAVFVMDNTDVMVLTVFTNLLEVSVYSIYNMIITGLKKVVFSFTNGLEAAFGNMIARNEGETLKQNVRIVETIMFSLSTVIYTCTALLIFSFVKIYTRNVTDINYIRPAFAYVIIIAHYFNGIRMPYQLVVQAAGHYKQTKKGAIIEPIINITLSVIFVIRFGLLGVAIGTLAATVYRTVQYSFYMSDHIVHRNKWIVFYRICVSAVECVICFVIVNALRFSIPKSYMSWFIIAILTTIISILVVAVGNCFFFKKDMMATLEKIKNMHK